MWRYFLIHIFGQLIGLLSVFLCVCAHYLCMLALSGMLTFLIYFCVWDSLFIIPTTALMPVKRSKSECSSALNIYLFCDGFCNLRLLLP